MCMQPSSKDETLIQHSWLYFQSVTQTCKELCCMCEAWQKGRAHNPKRWAILHILWTRNTAWRVYYSEEERTEKNRNGIAGLSSRFLAWLLPHPISPSKVLSLSPVGILPSGDCFRILPSSSKYLMLSMVVFISHSHISINYFLLNPSWDLFFWWNSIFNWRRWQVDNLVGKTCLGIWVGGGK